MRSTALLFSRHSGIRDSRPVAGTAAHIPTGLVQELLVQFHTGGETFVYQDRPAAELDAQRGKLTVIVEKVQAATLARGLLPLPDTDRYAIPRYVRHHFRRVAETRFFELYR